MGKRSGKNRAARDARYARLPKDLYRPLRITAKLQTPVITDGTLPIDAVMYYQAHRETLGSQLWTVPGGVALGRSGASLPLARCEEHGPNWYYAASFAQWPDAVAEGQDHWNCRIDDSLCYLVDFAGRRGRIETKSGPYKGFHQPVYYRHALQVIWYARGIRGSVERTLQFATHLGKKTSQGWGSVLEWRVEEFAEDWSVWGPGGKLMRAIPATDGIYTGFRPSYWAPGNQAICRMP